MIYCLRIHAGNDLRYRISLYSIAEILPDYYSRKISDSNGKRYKNSISQYKADRKDPCPHIPMSPRPLKPIKITQILHGHIIKTQVYQESDDDKKSLPFPVHICPPHFRHYALDTRIILKTIGIFVKIISFSTFFFNIFPFFDCIKNQRSTAFYRRAISR